MTEWDLRKLRVLQALDDCGTVTAAAERLLLSPSAVSQQLAVLARQLGAPMLEPYGRRVRLTSAARLVLGHAERVFGQLEQAEAELAGYLHGVAGEVRVGAANLVMPGKSRVMGDGWENRRRRDQGHDWVRLRLAGRGEIRAVEIDTANYLGNAAGWAALHARDGEHGDWFELVPRTRLQPDSVHRLLVTAPRAATHVRLDVFPDGGIARLRLHGSLTS